MEFKLTLYIFLGLLYMGFLFYMRRLWQVRPRFEITGGKHFQVSLIIPVRNEIVHLPRLFVQIQQLQFPRLQVLLIDDHSGDGSGAMIHDFIQRNPEVSVSYYLSEGQGKKAALETGIAHASGEIIFQSDADCEWPEAWVEKMTQHFQDSALQLIAGPVMSMAKPGFFSRFQQIEWGSVLLTTSVFFQTRRPLMCSGANLAYRKSAFIQVKGFEGNRDWLSGDDAFLLKKTVAIFGVSSVRYLPFQAHLVHTQPAENLSSYMAQRIRWAAKWRHPENASQAWSALGTFIFQLAFLGSFALLGSGETGILIFACFWGLKCVAEFGTLRLVLEDMGYKFKLMDHLGVSLLHPFYAIGVGLGTLFRAMEWKGRKNAKTEKLS